MENLGEILRRKRKEKGLTLQEVSQITGCSVGYLNDIEKGRCSNPSLNKLINLAPFLNLPPEYLCKPIGTSSKTSSNEERQNDKPNIQTGVIFRTKSNTNSVFVENLPAEIIIHFGAPENYVIVSADRNGKISVEVNPIM